MRIKTPNILFATALCLLLCTSQAGAVFADDSNGEAPLPIVEQVTARLVEGAPAKTEPTKAESAENHAVAFNEIENNVRNNNSSVLALQETINSVNALDYEEMTEDLRDALTNLANQQWSMITMGTIPGVEFSDGELISIEMSTTSASASLEQAYSSLRDSFDDLAEGKIKEDNDAVIRQLENAQNQIIMASEALYVALTELEDTYASLQRSSVALDRTVRETVNARNIACALRGNLV